MPCFTSTLPVCLCCVAQGYGSQRFVFQGVHETICYGPSDKPWGDTEPRINQIVFIGRKLDRKALMEGFRWGQGPGGLCSGLSETVAAAHETML